MARTARMSVALVALAALIAAPTSASSAQTSQIQFDPNDGIELDALPVALADAAAVPEDFAEYERTSLARGQLLHPYFDELSVLPGFESGGLAEGTETLEFYWHGEPPAAAREIAQRAKDEGRDLIFVQIAYSYAEIHEYSIALVTALGDAGIRSQASGRIAPTVRSNCSALSSLSMRTRRMLLVRSRPRCLPVTSM